MTIAEDDQSKSLDFSDRLIIYDPCAWRRAITELKEHNMRLAQIVCELLIKNQQLRNELEHPSN
jgi:hypothetical protein